MTIKAAREYIDRLYEQYIIKHTQEFDRDELIKENNIEQRDVKGYHGREILELLQNADDAYQKSINENRKPDCDLEVSIEYKNNCLTVTNTGTVFDKDGVKAIIDGNDSPKSGTYIGNKGTGFRSVLNWAKMIEIVSGPFGLRFSREYADKVFNEIKDKPQIKKQLQKNKKLYIPMLAVPKFIEGHEVSDNTSIKIFLDEEKQNDDYCVEKQIESIDLRILLFLPNTKRIVVKTDQDEIVYKSETDGKNVILIQEINGEEKKKEIFRVFDKSVEKAIEENGEKKDIQIKIAVPVDMKSFSPGCLYSYFPLLYAKSPFNCVMHCSYILGDHRDTLSRSSQNKIIIQKQLDGLIEVAEEYVNDGDVETALSILVPVEFDSCHKPCMSAFDAFDLQEYYFDKIKDVAFLETVDGKYISIMDEPLIIDDEFPACFKGNPFEKLLKCIEEPKRVSFVESLCKKYGVDTFIYEDDLVSRINDITENLTVAERVEVFAWWNKNPLRKSLPRLLKTQDGDYLEYKKNYFFLTGNFKEVKIPNWVKEPSIDAEYQEKLFEIAEDHYVIKRARQRESDKYTETARLIFQSCESIYPTVNFKYRDRNTIIPTVNESVVSDFERAVEFVKWLWENYSEKDEWTPPDKIKYRFPCIDRNGIKKVENGENLFFGDEYGNLLGKKLFNEEYSSFALYSLFDIRDDEMDKFVAFISKFGVRKYPAIEAQDIVPLKSYEEEINQVIKSNIDKKEVNVIAYHLKTIANIEEILSRLEMMEIIQWIIKDRVLFENLEKTYDSEAIITYKAWKQSTPHGYNGNYYKIKNYILEIFNEAKWIEIDGFDGKYSPRQVLKKNNNNLKFKKLVPVASDELFDKVAEKINADAEEVENIFNLFNSCEKATDLKSEDFYGLLLKIPDLGIKDGGALFEIIYRSVELFDRSPSYEKCSNKDEYMKTGKMLVEYQGKYQFVKASDACLPSTNIFNKKLVPIVVKGIRTNSKYFIEVFGCKKYQKAYKIIEDLIEISDANNEFQQYFKEFCRYANPFLEKNENIKNAKNLSITLVKQMFIKEDEIETRIDNEYECIRDKQTKWYITTFGDSFNVNDMSANIENIYFNIANTPGFDVGKIGEIFRAKDKSDREFLIKKEFGSLHVIDDSDQLKNNFLSALKKTVGDEFDESLIDIDFDCFDTNENIKKVIEIFKKNSIDMLKFRKNGFMYDIDFKSYYRSILNDFIIKNRREFQNARYNQACENASMQDDFIRTFHEFERFMIDFDSVKDIINLDVEQKVIEHFGEWKNVRIDLIADDEYRKNYEKMNPLNLYADEIANNEKLCTMFYFGREESFKLWLDDYKIKQESKKLEEDPYQKLRNIVPVKTEIEYNPPKDAQGGGRGGARGSYVQSVADKKNKEKKILGNKGELLVYNELCKTYGKENVYAKSEAFVDLGILVAGQAVSKGYDISYKVGEEEYFVEVKSGSSNSFFMSKNELEFAMDNLDRYLLYVVYDLDKDVPRYQILPKRFWENENFRRTDIIERIEYDF